mgnify:CR=1 FL=1
MYRTVPPPPKPSFVGAKFKKISNLDIPDVLEMADQPDAELVDHPEVELDRLAILLTLLLLEGRDPIHESGG